MNQRRIGWAIGAAVFMVAVSAGAFYMGVQQGAQNQASNPPPKHPNIPSGISPKLPPVSLPGSQTTASGNKYTHYRVGKSNVKSILADGNLMWIGSSGGVIRYDMAKDEHRIFDVRSGLLSNGVFHLSKINDQLAVGTYGGGLSLFENTTETWKNYNIQHGLADAFVYDVLQASNGDIWIATWSGANRIRGGDLDNKSRWDTFTVGNTKGGLPNDWVYGLREGSNGDIWMATEGGLALYKKGKWSNWQHDDGLGAPYEVVRDQIEFKRDPAKESSHHARQKAEQGLSDVDVAYNPNYIVSLEMDEDGTVWAGTWGGGLAHFDGKSWRNFTVKDGLPSNHIFLLHRDSKGRFWIGTSQGLVLREGEKFKVFTTADGLFANNIFSLALNQQGDLWVGGYGGVTRFAGTPGEN